MSSLRLMSRPRGRIMVALSLSVATLWLRSPLSVAAVVTIDFNGVDASVVDSGVSVPLPLPSESGSAYLSGFGVSVDNVVGPQVVIRDQARDYFDAIHAPSNALLQPGGFLDEWVGYTLVFDEPVVQVDIYLAPINEDVLAAILDAFPEFTGLEDLFYPAYRFVIEPDSPQSETVFDVSLADVGSSFGAAAGPYSALPGLLGDAIPADAPTFTRLRIEGNAMGTALFNNIVIDKLVLYTVPEPGSLALAIVGLLGALGLVQLGGNSRRRR